MSGSGHGYVCGIAAERRNTCVATTAAAATISAEGVRAYWPKSAATISATQTAEPVLEGGSAISIRAIAVSQKSRWKKKICFVTGEPKVRLPRTAVIRIKKKKTSATYFSEHLRWSALYDHCLQNGTIFAAWFLQLGRLHSRDIRGILKQLTRWAVD